VQSNARVDLTGGSSPTGGIVLTGTTNASGVVTFSVPTNATANYNLKAYSGTLTGTVSGFAVSTATAKTVTVS